MLQDLFVNACILITFIFIASQIFQNTGLGKDSSTQIRTTLGIFAGIASCVLTYFSINVTGDLTLDFRDICIILSSLFGGIYSVLITGLITAAFRLTYHGINHTSIVSASFILFVCIGCGLLSKIKSDMKMKARLLLLFCLLVRSMVYMILLENTLDIVYTILSAWISYIIIGYGIAYLVRYLVGVYDMIKMLKNESSHDYLTGLSNSRIFERNYNLRQQEALKSGNPFALMIIDIDHFKRVNDTYGHAAGDEVLKKLGRLLKLIGKNYCLVSRIGGEEFSILILDLSKEAVKEIGEKIRTTIQAESFPIHNNMKIKITVSIGIAIYPETVTDINKLKEHADKKLYEAKWSGRNRVCI